MTCVLVMLMIEACDVSSPLTSSERNDVNELIGKFSPRCVGRYMIDIPDDALIFGSAKVDGVTLEAKAMSQDEYFAEINIRAEDLKNSRHARGYKFLLEDVESRSVGYRYFVHLENKHGGNIVKIVEAYKWSQGFQIKLKAKGNDVTTSSEKDNPSAMDIGNDIPQKIDIVIELLEKVSGREDGDIPYGQGLCFHGGFLSGPASRAEHMTTSFVLHDKQDVSFVIDTNADIVEKTTLLERGGKLDGILSASGDRTIRKGTVTLNDLSAEEWLIAGLTPLGFQGHYFTLEANSKVSGAKSPLLILDMNNGGFAPSKELQPKHASLTEGEAIALWDVVSRSLRPRYNGF